MSSDEMLSTSHSPEPQPDEPTIVSMTMEESPSALRPTPAAAATTTTPTTTKATPSQQPSNKKRAASTSEPTGAAKVTKRRAARACVSQIPLPRNFCDWPLRHISVIIELCTPFFVSGLLRTFCDFFTTVCRELSFGLQDRQCRVKHSFRSKNTSLNEHSKKNLYLYYYANPTMLVCLYR